MLFYTIYIRFRLAALLGTQAGSKAAKD